MATKGFIPIWNHLSSLFPIHLNTYVMGLRSLEIFYSHTDVRFWRLKSISALWGLRQWPVAMRSRWADHGDSLCYLNGQSGGVVSVSADTQGRPWAVSLDDSYNTKPMMEGGPGGGGRGGGTSDPTALYSTVIDWPNRDTSSYYQSFNRPA